MAPYNNQMVYISELQSPGTYSSMNFLTLPDRTTLLQYCNFTKAHAEINPDVLEHFLLSFNAEEMNTKDKTLSISYIK